MSEQLEDKIHQISDTYAISSDNYNVILYEKYEKMDGVGRNANPTGEIGWRVAKNGAYFGNIERLRDNLADKAEKETIGVVGVEFDKFKAYMDEWKADLKDHLNEHITLELAKVKGKSEEENK